MERFYINIGPKALFEGSWTFDSLRGSISYRVRVPVRLLASQTPQRSTQISHTPKA